MSNSDKEPLIKPSTKRTLIHALLRSIPILPDPEIYDLVIDLKRSRASIDEKIEKATKSLQDASLLIDDLEQSLSGRAEKLKVLREEIERYSQIAEVEENKAKAIIQ